MMMIIANNNKNSSNVLNSFDFFDLFVLFIVNDNNNNHDNYNKWNSFKIDFFDFMYDNKPLITAEFIKYIEKNIYFRDVHLFINRIKNMIVCKNLELLRNNLYICLRDTVMY